MQLAEAREQLLGFPEKMQLVSSSAVTSSWSWARWPELTWHAFILYSLPKPLLGAPCWGFTERGRHAHSPEEETPGHSWLLPGEWGGRRTGRRCLVQLEKEEGWDRENGVFHLEQWSSALSAQPPWDVW